MSILCLRILEAALLYANTRMLQGLIVEQDWAEYSAATATPVPP